MQNGYIFDTLTSVDIQKLDKIGGKIIEIFEGVFYRKIFKNSPFRKVIDKLFVLKLKYKDEINDVVQLLVNILLKSIYAEQIRIDFEESFACKSEYWIMTEFDERVKGFWRKSHGNYIVKMIDDIGLEDEVNKINAMPLYLRAFVLSNSERIMNKSFMLSMDFIQMIFITETTIQYI